MTKVLGATALLSCVVTGYPAPHVRWMLGDKLVEERYEPAIVLLPVLLLLWSHIGSSNPRLLEIEQQCSKWCPAKESENVSRDTES